MNREHYLEHLRARLSGGMTAQELEDVLAYYREYFEEAGPEREQAVITELGSPENLAHQIMGDRVLQDLEHPQPGRPRRRGMRAVWTVILAVFAAPIAIPLAVAAVAVALALVIAVLAVVLGVGAAGLVSVMTGVAVAICGVGARATLGGATTLFFGGTGIAAVGIGLLLGTGAMALGNVCLRGIAKGLGRMLHKRGRKA